MYDYHILFLLFILYSFLGWVIEVINEFTTSKKFVNRGFLIGPYCPIYGFGGVFITILLTKYQNDIIVLFILSIIICSFLEYFTSYIMEKIFNARWWDYSNKKFNLNGRICLETMIPFGLLGVFMIYFLNPFIIDFLSKFPINTIYFVSVIIMAIFGLDIIVSTFILSSVKDDISKIDLDNTEEISKKVKESLMSMSWIKRRVFEAFPNAKYIKDKIKNNISNVLTKERKKQEKIKIEMESEIKKIKLESDYKIQKIRKKANEKIEKLNKEE